jgi:hypothetical protein
MYPGSFPNTKHNLFNTVLVMDLTLTSNVHFIATTVANIVNRGLPFRFGLVPVVDNDDSALFSWRSRVKALMAWSYRPQDGEVVLLYD